MPKWDPPFELLSVLDRNHGRRLDALHLKSRSIWTGIASLAAAALCAGFAGAIYFLDRFSNDFEFMRQPFVAVLIGIGMLALLFFVRSWAAFRASIKSIQEIESFLSNLNQAIDNPARVRDILLGHLKCIEPNAIPGTSTKRTPGAAILAKTAETTSSDDKTPGHVTPGTNPGGTQVQYQDILDLFEEDGWKCDTPEANIIRMGIQAANTNLQVLVNFQPAREAILVVAVFPQRIPDVDRRALCEMIARINHELLFGNLEMDLEDGELRFRASMPVDNAPFYKNQFRTILYTAIKTCDRYYPAMMSVIFGNRSPKQAMEDIEGR